MSRGSAPKAYAVLWLLLLLGLSGCASLQPPSQPVSSHDPSQLQHWQVRGKLAVIGPEESATGYLTWDQNRDAYDLFIAGPFGARASRLYGDAQQAYLQLPGWPQAAQAANSETLMQLYLGWNFPLASLTYWIQGQPAPSGETLPVYDEQGLLSSLQQHGWTIHYSRYQQQQGYWLPRLIKMQGYGYRFNFAIAQWNFYDL